MQYSMARFLTIFSFDLSDPQNSKRGIASFIVQDQLNISLYFTFSVYESEQKSIIIKIYLNKNRIIPLGEAKIRGHINNQFSMDQYSHKLRVATTSAYLYGFRNNIYCFDFFMKEIGSLLDIARSHIFLTSRFVDHRLYLVDFTENDLFFVISLEDHRHPKIQGELKIPGFSLYLLPYSQNTVISFGRQSGLSMSLYDFTDANNPILRDRFEFSEKYYSSAENVWKSFFSRLKNLLVIPGGSEGFNGSLVFYVDPSKIELKGVINHRQGAERSFYIEELLYTKTRCSLKVNRIRDLASIRRVTIPC